MIVKTYAEWILGNNPHVDDFVLGPSWGCIVGRDGRSGSTSLASLQQRSHKMCSRPHFNCCI